MTAIAEKILAYAEARPEGALLSARELLHLGERAAVDQALSRLARQGALLRVGRGLYARPRKTRFGESAPAPESILEEIARRTGETITVSGATAANRLGLTTQNPVKAIYLTSGPNRRLRLGRQVVELRHAPAWQLRAGSSRAGDALRALAWYGPSCARAKIGPLRKKLSEEEQAELAAMRSAAPTWLARELSALASHG